MIMNKPMFLHIPKDVLESIHKYLNDNDIYSKEIDMDERYHHICHHIRYMDIDDVIEPIFRVTAKDIFYLHDIIHSEYYDNSYISSEFKNRLKRITKGQLRLNLSPEEIMILLSWAETVQLETGEFDGNTLELYNKLETFMNN